MNCEKHTSRNKVEETTKGLILGPNNDRSNRTRQFRQPGICLLLCGILAVTAASEEAEPGVKSFSELKQMSLEELTSYKVTSVSKREELLSEAASAIQVITSEDIRRSGATSIPEALRLASNLQVAQVDSRQWAITARGFNSTTANKLLVLMDGRSIYTPLYSGVFWDVQDTLLDDVDRIEVISGPGGTLWGANATFGFGRRRQSASRLCRGSLWRTARPAGVLPGLCQTFRP